MKRDALSYSPLCPYCTKVRCVGCLKKFIKLFKSKHHARLSEFFDLDDDIVMIDITFRGGNRVIVRGCEVNE